MLSEFVPMLRTFELKDSLAESFCPASYLPERLEKQRGTVFCLIEAERGSGTVIRSGTSFNVDSGTLWIASPWDVFSFGGNGEWTVNVMVINGRLFENVYEGFPGESALETWYRSVEVGTVCCEGSFGYDETVALCRLLKSISDTEESEFTAVSYLWQITAVLRRILQDTSPAGGMRVRPPRRLLATMRYMQENYGSKITLGELAKTANMSVSNFSAVFRRTFEMAPMEYLLQLRLRRAAYLLQHTDEKIIMIAEECGFFSNSNFIKAFSRMTGKTPSEFRKEGREK